MPSNPIVAVQRQALNIGIYRAIGNPGVYYGFKLGHNIPWHTGFPFNVVSHPQYVGSALTVWGAVALVRCRRHATCVAAGCPGPKLGLSGLGTLPVCHDPVCCPVNTVLNKGLIPMCGSNLENQPSGLASCRHSAVSYNTDTPSCGACSFGRRHRRDWASLHSTGRPSMH